MDLQAVRLDAAEAPHQRVPGPQQPDIDPEPIPWQFKNFLITDGD